MTDTQRSILEHLADPTLCVLGMKYIEAIGAALNEIDRQWAELAESKAHANEVTERALHLLTLCDKHGDITWQEFTEKFRCSLCMATELATAQAELIEMCNIANRLLGERNEDMKEFRENLRRGG